MELEPFSFHLSERTTLTILRDPLLPAAPTFADIRAALLRMDATKNKPSEQVHPHIGVGYCRICKHYGEDCTGQVPA